MKRPLQPKQRSRNPSQLQQRLKMLEYGWFPIPCEGKSWIIHNWPHLAITPELVREWDGYGDNGCKFAGTGTRIEGSMFVLDLDIKEREIIDAVLEAIGGRFPEWLYAGCLWRHSGAESLAIFSQVSEPVGGFHSASFGIVQPDGRIARKAHCEVYGGKTNGKYFAVAGPHSVAGREYGWLDDKAPWNTRLDSLPVFDADRVYELIELVEEVLARFLPKVKAARDLTGLHNQYTLTEDTIFVQRDGSTITCGELERILPIGPENGIRGLMSMADWNISDSKAHCNAFRRASGRLMITDFFADVNYYWANELGEEPVELGKMIAELPPRPRMFEEPAGPRAAPEPPADDEPADDADEPAQRSLRMSEIPFDPKNMKETYGYATAWLLEYMAHYPHAFNGHAGAVSIWPDGEFTKPVTIASLRGSMTRFCWQSTGPRGGIKIHNPVDYWLKLPNLKQVFGIRMRPELDCPTFYEDGVRFINRYVKPNHPGKGGTIGPFKERMRGLVPDKAERTWVWNFMACLVQHPEWRMIALAMLARDNGAGRGLFAEVLQMVLGEAFVVSIPYGSVTGGTRFNADVVDRLLIVVNESHTEEAHKYHTKNAAKEALKVFIEPNHRIPFRVEPKGIDAYFTHASVSTLLLTNNINGLPVGEGDRRLAIVVNGPQMTVAEREHFQAWMLKAENIGALYRYLRDWPIEQNKSIFDPYMAPEFAGRDLMIDANKTELDHAFEAAIAKLDTATELATMTQIVAVTRHFAKSRDPGFEELVRKHTVAANQVYRIGTKNGTNWLVRYPLAKPGVEDDGDNRERVYAFNRLCHTKWSKGDANDIRKQLSKAQEVVDEPSRAFSKLLHSIPGGRTGV